MNKEIISEYVSEKYNLLVTKDKKVIDIETQVDDWSTKRYILTVSLTAATGFATNY